MRILPRMPIQSGAVTFSRFRAEPIGRVPRDQGAWLTRGLQLRAFSPIDRNGEQERAVGFVELESEDSVEFAPSSFSKGEYLVASYRIDQIKIPPSVVRAELEKWKQAFEIDKARPPGRVERAEARMAIRQELRNSANPTTRTIDLSWNLKTNLVQVWTVSRKLVDEVAEAFQKSFDTKLIPLLPPVIAEEMGIPESSLHPTPELSCIETRELSDDEA